MNNRRCPRTVAAVAAVAAGLLASVTLLAAACSDGGDGGDGGDGHPPMQPTGTESSPLMESSGPQIEDHTAEIAQYKSAVQAALPVRTDMVFSSSGIVTGADTAEGWQVQNQRNSFYGQDTAVGSRQVELVCAGLGEVQVNVTVRTTQGGEVSTTPVSTTCSVQGSTSRAEFEVGRDDGGFDVDVVPAGDAVAVLGYVVT